VSEYKFDVNRGSELADPVSTLAGDKAKPTQDFVSTAATIGMIAAGVALFEVALIPGMVIGAAAVLAPKYVPKLRRRLRPLLNSTVRRRIEPALAPPDRPDVKVPLVAPAGFAIKQALAKTITFQIIVTTLDFTTHYVVVGNLATAASLSASHLVVRPLYYLVHETAWNYLSPPVRRKAGLGDLFRPRDGLGLLWLALGASPRPTDVHKPRAGGNGWPALRSGNMSPAKISSQSVRR